MINKITIEACEIVNELDRDQFAQLVACAQKIHDITGAFVIISGFTIHCDSKPLQFSRFTPLPTKDNDRREN